MRIVNVLFLSLFVLLASCGSTTQSAGAGTELTYVNQELAIQTAGGVLSLTVELADSDQKRTVGLMNRQSLEPDHGMLFIFEDESNHGFWMKDTFISLDIIFINAAKRIVYIEESATPLSLDAIRASDDSLYVLEVVGGYSELHGVSVGDVVVF